MNCAQHTEIAATAFCRECGKPMCPECQRPALGSVYCDVHLPATPPVPAQPQRQHLVTMASTQAAARGRQRETHIPGAAPTMPPEPGTLTGRTVAAVVITWESAAPDGRRRVAAVGRRVALCARPAWTSP